MKRLLLLGSALALTAGMFAASPSPAIGWGGHDHGPGNTNVVHPGESIQAAIDAAPAGATIFVRPGTYQEHLVITHPVHLLSWGATLAPPAAPGPESPCSQGGPNNDGICIAGDFTATPDGMVTVNNFIDGVAIVGFHITGFQGSGVIQIGGRDSVFAGNVADGNGDYGLAAFDSVGTKMVFNRATGSGEAGLYIGDSHPANAIVFANETAGNGFGVFVRDAEQGYVVFNRVHDNCIGVLFLGDAPGPDGAFTVFGNLIVHNDKACPANEESGPISGVGVGIASAHDVNVVSNWITDNVPGGPTSASGGVVVITIDPGGTAPTNNTVHHNLIVRNQPDITWDGTGTGNTFAGNFCQTSNPSGLC